jgi:hypothetical protein
MKVIVSHDIDHLTAWEHGLKDAILPKYLARMHVELISRHISFQEYVLRIKSFFTNKWNHLDALIAYNQSLGIPSHFFVGVNNGVGLSYDIHKVSTIIQSHGKASVKFGVHGIAFDNKKDIQNEFNRFAEFSKKESFGMRMHYVRKTTNTMKWISEAGYAFDSTEYSFGSPYKIGTMWEFPFQIMDSWIMEQGKKWQSVNLEKAKTITLKELEKAEKEQLPYLGVIFHDHYFSPAHRSWMNWYIWFTGYLKDHGYEFIRFEDAIKELEK